MAQPPQPAFSGSGHSGNIPLLYNIEEPALGEFKRSWTSYLLRSCANLGARNADTGLPEVPQPAQYVLIQDCFAQGSPAAAWQDSVRSTIEAPASISQRMDLLWAALAREAVRITPDQLYRYRTLAMAPNESTAAFGQRIIAAWNGVKASEPEAHAIALFLDGIKASTHLRFAVNSAKPENRTIVKVVAMAVDVQLQEGISNTQLIAKTAKPVKDLDITDAEFRALAKKKGISLAPTAKINGRAQVGNPSTSKGFYCEHHGTNSSHDTSHCYVLNPSLRPQPTWPAQAHSAASEEPTVNALLAGLSSLLANCRPGQISRKTPPQLDAMIGPNPPHYQGQGRPGQHNSSTQQRPSLFCHFCQQSGHLEDRC